MLMKVLLFFSSSYVVKIYRLKLHVLRNIIWFFFLRFFQKLINLILIFFFIIKFVIVIMSRISGLPVKIVFEIVFIEFVMTIFTWAWFSAAFVVNETRTVFFETMRFFAWTIYKRITCGINRLFVLAEWVQMEILSLRRLLFADLKLKFFLFSIQKSIGIIFAAFTFT